MIFKLFSVWCISEKMAFFLTLFCWAPDFCYAGIGPLLALFCFLLMGCWKLGSWASGEWSWKLGFRETGLLDCWALAGAGTERVRRAELMQLDRSFRRVAGFLLGLEQASNGWASGHNRQAWAPDVRGLQKWARMDC